GEITTGDNQGTWTPACRLNWVTQGGFYGVVDLAHRDPPPTRTDNPLCWRDHPRRQPGPLAPRLPAQLGHARRVLRRRRPRPPRPAAHAHGQPVVLAALRLGQLKRVAGVGHR